MPDCPHCTQPMRLTRDATGRVYHCRCGYVSEVLPADQPLSLGEISEDLMQQRYIDASQVAAKQAWHRRLVAQLKDAYQSSPYLSEVEIESLQDGARILEKIARAAELAKQSKHQQHLESKQTQRLRYKKALAELDCSDLFDEDNVIDLALHVLTLSELRADVLPAIDLDLINHIVAQAPSTGSVVFHLINQLRQLQHDQREGLARSLSLQPDVDGQMQALRAAYVQLRPQIRQQHYAVIDAIQNILSLDHRRWEP